MNRLLIVDGHAYAYRAFHAIRELRSPSGNPTNAIFGFVKMLEKMRLAIEPSHLIVVWDGGLSQERLAALPDYKAQRPKMPVDLEVQLDEISEFLLAAGVPVYCGDGVEADDYIASIARVAASVGWNVVIASSDKDFMQLVSVNIGLLNPNDKTGVVWGREQVKAKTGVEPEQIADWLALMGDAVDNIPGVPGVGTKTATGLLCQFRSLDQVIVQIDQVKSEKLRKSLKESVPLLERNKNLVRLPQLKLNFEPDGLLVRQVDRSKLRDLYLKWGFKGMLNALEEASMEKQSELI